MSHRLAVIVAITACQGGVPRFAGGTLTPLDIEDDRLLVSVRLDGQPHVLVLDTAASITSISTLTARELGIEIDGTTQINGGIPATLGVIHSLSIGLADHADVRVAIVDMPNARNSAVAFDGILGLDVLSGHDVVLDFRHHTLALHPSGAIVRNGLLPWMARVELQRGSYGLITLDVTLDGHPPIPAILDLGAPTTVANGAAASMLGVYRPAFHPQTVSVGGVMLEPRDMVIHDLPVFARFGLADRPAILLGSDVFKNRALVIAYRDQMAMLSR